MAPRKSVRRVLALAALVILAVLGARPVLAATVVLPGGGPDPNCQDLRLWLRADAGVRDAAGHGPTDPAFSGSVATWSDQSGRHFDLAAPPEQAPSYVTRQPGAGNQPTVAFGGGRMLARPKEPLHDHVNSTTLLVLQIQRGREQGNVVFCAGDPGGKREALTFERINEADPRSLPAAGGPPPIMGRPILTILFKLPPTAASPSSFSARPATVLPWRFKTDWATPWARIAR